VSKAMKRRPFWFGTVVSILIISLLGGLFSSAQASDRQNSVLGEVKEATTVGTTYLGVAQKRFVSGWLPYWRGSSTVDNLVAQAGEKGKLSEVMLFWLFFQSGRNKVCVHDMSAPLNSCPKKLTPAQLAQRDRLKSAGVHLYPSITDGGAPMELSNVLGNPVKRKAFVKEITDFVVKYKFKGIDLDLEGFAFRDGYATWAETRPRWVNFINELSASLKAVKKKLSVTVPVGLATSSESTGYWVYDWSAILPKVNRLRLMTYDYSFYDYDSLTHTYRDPGAMGPYPWMEKVVQGVKAKYSDRLTKKVWLGIAAFGYDGRISTTCSTPSEPRRRTVYPNKVWAFAQAMKDTGRLLTLEGDSEPRVKWDSVNRERVFRYSEPDVEKNTNIPCSSVREVWFQDGRGHAQRALLAGKYGLGGVSLWAFGDESSSTWSLLNRIKS